LQAATRKLSVSAILLGILGGIIGLGVGLFLGFALGAALAAAFHVSTFEGEAGYFAVAIAILVTLVVTPWNALSSTRWLNKCGFTA
jgi:ABC-type antimicrobial peptide transport system permease subunit